MHVHEHEGPTPEVLELDRPSPMLAEDGAEQWAQIFDVLSDPNRLRLLVAIHHHGSMYVKDLADHTGMSGTAVSHALRLLRNTGTVAPQRDGQRVYYTLSDPLVHELLHRLTGTDAHPLSSRH